MASTVKDVSSFTFWQLEFELQNGEYSLVNRIPLCDWLKMTCAWIDHLLWLLHTRWLLSNFKIYFLNDFLYFIRQIAVTKIIQSSQAIEKIIFTFKGILIWPNNCAFPTLSIIFYTYNNNIKLKKRHKNNLFKEYLYITSKKNSILFL